MEMKLNRETIKEMLIQYYREYENIECDILIKTDIECIGYYEQDECVVSFIQIRKLNFMGKELKTKTILTDDEIENIIKILLRDNQLDLADWKYDKKIKTEYRGTNWDEYTVDKPYFGGIIINTKELNNGKQYIKERKK